MVDWRSSGKGGPEANPVVHSISSLNPDFEIHQVFSEKAHLFLDSKKEQRVFKAAVERSGIDRRYSVLPVSSSTSFLKLKALGSMGIQERMQIYETDAKRLTKNLLVQGVLKKESAGSFTHVVTASCTGFFAPHLDEVLISELGFSNRLQRVHVGFMGCFAAVQILRVAQGIVALDPSAKVLILALEFCTLHFTPTGDLNELISFSLFGDGLAAAVVESKRAELPTHFEILESQTRIWPEHRDLITWRMGSQSFEMHLDRQVPRALKSALKSDAGELLGGSDVLYAVHPGGRAILQAFQEAVHEIQGLRSDMASSLQTLCDFGNMSSVTLLFVLKKILDRREQNRVKAFAFGPGFTVEALGLQPCQT